MEKRSILPKLFQSKPKDKELIKFVDSKIEELTYFRQYFHTTNLYMNDIARASAKRIATDLAQVMVKHQIKRGKNHYDDIENSNIAKLFRIRPNAFMTPFDYFYQVGLNLILNGVSYTYVERDERGVPIALIPIEAEAYQTFKIDDKYFIKFFDLRGNELLVDMELLIVNRRDQPRMIVNENPFKVIKHVIELLDTNYSALKSAMVNGGKINAIMKYTSIMSDAQMEKAIERFQKTFLNIGNFKIAGLDSTVDFKQLDPMRWEILDIETMNFLKEKIYNYIGINQNIVEGKANEGEILSYVALMVEPLALNLSQEYTYKLFSKKELEVGNRLFFDTRLLKFATLSARTTYYDKMVSHGVLSINEVRAMEGLSPIPNGDVHRVTLNSVTLEKANEYQLGHDEGGDEDEESGGDEEKSS